MKILFVCLGNICRSPIAEGILKKLVAEKGLNWQIDSAGIERYHVGESPDTRAINVCRKNGIDISRQRARKITIKDFEEFDLIYALAEDIYEELDQMKTSEKFRGRLLLLLEESYPGKKLSVPDPWYGKESDFYPVFDLINTACTALVEKYSAGIE